MVLLKNEGPLLPFKRQNRIAFIGAFAEHPRYQGAGSSHITPTHMDSVLAEARSLAGEDVIEYAAGYSLTTEQADPELLKEAASLAGKSDSAVVFTGLAIDTNRKGSIVSTSAYLRVMLPSSRRWQKFRKTWSLY